MKDRRTAPLHTGTSHTGRRGVRHLDRKSFTDTVLMLLETGVSPKHLNLRGVAKELGCAHTNAYNYVSSFDELLWWSVKAALEELVQSIGTESNDLLETYIDYGVAHPAWYRLIWLDPLPGPPPEEVTDYLSVPARTFLGWVADTVGTSSTDPDLQRKTTLLHSYLHGELSAYVAGRLPISADAARERMRAGSTEIWNHLFEKEKR